MTDKELLEYAAKSAGIECKWIGNEESGFLSSNDKLVWNPLKDDGDALRLAVKLRINIEWTSTLTKHTEEWVSTYPKSLGHLSDLIKLDDDPNAATRRAIVRASAAIGEKM